MREAFDVPDSFLDQSRAAVDVDSLEAVEQVLLVQRRHPPEGERLAVSCGERKGLERLEDEHPALVLRNDQLAREAVRDAEIR